MKSWYSFMVSHRSETGRDGRDGREGGGRKEGRKKGVDVTSQWLHRDIKSGVFSARLCIAAVSVTRDSLL